VTIRRVDDTGDCAGLVPARVPAAVEVELNDAGPSCGPGLSEGGGHVAVVRQSGRGFAEVQVFSPDGKPERALTVSTFGGCFLPTTCGPLFPQESGFMAATATGGTGSFDPLLVHVHTFAADGTLRRTESPTTHEMGVFAWGLHDDPLGGVLLTTSGFVPPDLPDRGTCNGHAFRFGRDGRQRGRSDFACRVVTAGVSNGGESLVMESGEPSTPFDQLDVLLHWLKPDGSPAQPETSERSPFTSGAHLAPLLQGGLLLNDGGTWTRRYPHLGAASEPAPEWIASKPGWTYRFTRGNKGYAAFPPPGQQLVDCDPGVELRSVSGRLCGTITFREEGGACRSAAIDQGWDGTVVRQSARNACRWRWWPKLLAR
jgi:hypothetical protein